MTPMLPTILTHSGINFNLLEPDASMIRIDDIAHALSHLCRFTGHTRCFYSVAEHCIRASEHVPPQFALEALLHDATEAYLGDVSSPLKTVLHEYRMIEFRLDCVIRYHFGLPLKSSPQVKQADLAMLATERAHLMPFTDDHWPLLDGITPAEPIEQPLTPLQAKGMFLYRFHSLQSLQTTAKVAA
jgi:uncharacterized protein